MDDSLTMPLQIGLAVALILSFFASFLSAKTWKVGQIVLVFFIFLASGAFMFMTAAALKIQQSHGERANNLLAQIDMEQKTQRVLLEGRDALGVDEAILANLEKDNEAYVEGLRNLEVELHNALIGRGRVWSNVVGGAPGADGTVSITVESPTPHAMNAKSVVYVFEEGSLEEGAHYLGEFAVTGTGEGAATLTPAITFSPAAMDRLNNSNSTWIIYEKMPADTHDLFAELDENELRALLPERSVDEYLKDGKAASPDDPESRVVSRKIDGEAQSFYQRRLRDYETHFHELQLQFFVLQNLVEQKERDNALLEQTVAKTNSDIQAREVEVENLKSDLAHVNKDVQVISKHSERVSAVAERLKTSAKTLLAQVQRDGVELGKLQLKALKDIEESDPPAEDPTTTTAIPAKNPVTTLVGP